MKNIFKIFSYSLSSIGLFFLFLLQKNKYSWMGEMDPSTSYESLEDPGNKLPVVTAIAIFIVIIQSIHFFKTKNSKEKFIPLVFIAVTLSVLFFKFVI